LYSAYKSTESLGASVAKEMCFQRSSEIIEGKSRLLQFDGRSFHSRGPAAEKLLSPCLLCVRGTSSFHMSLKWDLSGQWPASDRRWQSSIGHLCADSLTLDTSTSARIPTTQQQAYVSAIRSMLSICHGE